MKVQELNLGHIMEEMEGKQHGDPYFFAGFTWILQAVGGHSSEQLCQFLFDFSIILGVWFRFETYLCVIFDSYLGG